MRTNSRVRESGSALLQNAAVVKSAARVLRILELFASANRSMKSSEIASALMMPSSSTSVLLHSLVYLGYLTFDPLKRTFFPSCRLALLGSHFMNNEENQAILNMMQCLNRETKETILLGMESGHYVQYIGVLRGTLPVKYHGRPGTRRILPAASCGIALLGRRSDREIYQIIQAMMARESTEMASIDVSGVMAQVFRYRERGYSYVPSQTMPSVGVVACRLPDSPSLAVGILGAADRIRKNERRIGDMLVKAVRRAACNSA